MNLSELQEVLRTGKPSMLQSMGSQRVGHNLATEQQPILETVAPCNIVPQETEMQSRELKQQQTFSWCSSCCFPVAQSRLSMTTEMVTGICWILYVSMKITLLHISTLFVFLFPFSQKILFLSPFYSHYSKSNGLYLGQFSMINEQWRKLKNSGIILHQSHNLINSNSLEEYPCPFVSMPVHFFC